MKQAKEIKIWVEKNGGIKLPTKHSNDEEERRLGIALGSIKEQLIKPYCKLETEEVRKIYRER